MSIWTWKKKRRRNLDNHVEILEDFSIGDREVVEDFIANIQKHQ
jgi:hypothetical protein